MTGHRGLQHSLSVVVPRLVSVKCLSVGLILLLSFYFAWMTVTRLDESGTKLEDTGRHQYGWLQQSLSVVVPRLVSVKCPSIGLILLLSFYFAWMTVPRLDDKELNDISKSVSLIHYQDPVIKVRQRLVNSSYDLMIFSYMRSGSTMTGEVFAENRDFFFVFEPLLSIVPYQYLTTTDVCKMRNTECSPEDFENKLNGAMGTLHNIYDCNLRDIEPNTLEYIVQENKSGPAWSQFADCTNTSLRGLNLTIKSIVAKRNDDIHLPQVNIIDHCFETLENTCRKSKAKVTKVLRLSMKLIPKLLKQLPNLKILLLVRDPRAIINSRLITDWFPICEKDLFGVLENAESLCKKMDDDILVLSHLTKEYPDRLLVHRLEDAVKNSPKLFKGIFNFMNLGEMGVQMERIKRKYDNQNYKGFSEKWTKMLKDQFKTMVDDNCQNILQYYKYVR